MPKQPPYALDLRGAFCPMAFVKTKIHLDSLSNGDVTTVLYEDSPSNEPLVRSIESLGHTIVCKSTVQPDTRAPMAKEMSGPHKNSYVQLTLLKIEVNR